jgi:hypothetical protein
LEEGAEAAVKGLQAAKVAVEDADATKSFLQN